LSFAIRRQTSQTRYGAIFRLFDEDLAVGDDVDSDVVEL